MPHELQVLAQLQEAAMTDYQWELQVTTEAGTAEKQVKQPAQSQDRSDKFTWELGDITIHKKGEKQVYGWQLEVKGGRGSGHWGHAGRPGKRGGSLPGGGLHRVARIPRWGHEAADGERNNVTISNAMDQRTDSPNGWRGAKSYERGAVKHALVTGLSETSGVDYNTCNLFVKQWMWSSNDRDMRSLSIQRDAANEFGEELSDFTKRRITEKERACASDPGWSNPGCEQLYPSDVQRKILRAEYENTQKFLREQGIGPDDVITLYRGAKWDKEITKDWKVGDKVAFHDNTLASWSLGRDKAEIFVRRDSQKDGVLLKITVPARMIISTALTGRGCLTEGELIVLGGRGTAELLDIQRTNY